MICTAGTGAKPISGFNVVFDRFSPRFLRSSALKTKYKALYRPSTGAVMLLAALHSCDQVKRIVTVLLLAVAPLFTVRPGGS